MSIPPNSSFSLIFDTITVILTIITTAYYWLVIPRPISGARDTAATFQNDVGVHFPGVWWIRSFTLLGSCSSVALLVTGALERDGVAVRLGYCVAVFQLLTEATLKLVVWAERLVSLVELSAIMLVWSLRPEGREYIPIVLLAGSAFKSPTE
ncbi:hypothetical protein E2P81_ATG10737 [Venturia nashicola]|nr:hypothetical protein E2P81_ATG10737 [Venturia nashicola]